MPLCRPNADDNPAKRLASHCRFIRRLPSGTAANTHLTKSRYTSPHHAIDHLKFALVAALRADSLVDPVACGNRFFTIIYLLEGNPNV